jgi:hypothetical protein
VTIIRAFTKDGSFEHQLDLLHQQEKAVGWAAKGVNGYLLHPAPTGRACLGTDARSQGCTLGYFRIAPNGRACEMRSLYFGLQSTMRGFFPSSFVSSSRGPT